MTTEKSREARLRRIAKHYDLELRKSRTQNWHIDDCGQYQIADPHINGIVAGSRFDMTLDDVEEYFRDEATSKISEDRI